MDIPIKTNYFDPDDALSTIKERRDLFEIAQGLQKQVEINKNKLTENLLKKLMDDGYFRLYLEALQTQFEISIKQFVNKFFKNPPKCLSQIPQTMFNENDIGTEQIYQEWKRETISKFVVH